ncbi:MAG: hypothetical protein PHI86_01440 [Candidatus Omnitrophica bacterium]|nr:hypothetical protein [Candidatus Omnitrophota bacterium]
MKRLKLTALILSFTFCILSFANLYSLAFAEEKLPSKDYVAKAWEAIGKRQWEMVLTLTNACIECYKQEADKQQASLTEFPAMGKEGIYQ